jgi:DNA-binding response OmpR family regulator
MDPYVLLTVARSQSLATRLHRALDSGQYQIRWVPSATQALGLDFCPSLVILDIPATGGQRIARGIKEHYAVPILGLIPADVVPPPAVDESLRRPFAFKSLVGCIESTLLAHTPHVLHAPGLSLDTRTRILRLEGSPHTLRPIGCRIMAELMSQCDCVVPRDELFGKVWRTDDGDHTRALDVHIARLRRQLEPDPHHPRLILTERGVGYRLRPPV